MWSDIGNSVLTGIGRSSHEPVRKESGIFRPTHCAIRFDDAFPSPHFGYLVNLKVHQPTAQCGRIQAHTTMEFGVNPTGSIAESEGRCEPYGPPVPSGNTYWDWDCSTIAIAVRSTRPPATSAQLSRTASSADSAGESIARAMFSVSTRRE